MIGVVLYNHMYNNEGIINIR